MKHKTLHLLCGGVLLLTGCDEGYTYAQDPSTAVTQETTPQPPSTPEITQPETSDENVTIPESTTAEEATEIDLSAERVTLKSGEMFEKQYRMGSCQYGLKDMPVGMRILPKTGYLAWTPTMDQVGDFNVTLTCTNTSGEQVEKAVNFNVSYEPIVYNGVFMDLSNQKHGDGTPQNPYGRFKDFCSKVEPGENIYVRGGEYFNPHYGDFSVDDKSRRYSVVRDCYGTAEKPITIRPWGNEFVKINFDARNGLNVEGRNKYLIIEGFEVEGAAQKISYDDAIAHWWYTSDYYNGGGINTKAFYVTVRNNIVYNTPGGGISGSEGYTTIENNIVYNTDWWTIAGSKAIGITLSENLEGDEPADDEARNIIRGNLIASTEQRIFSRVWKKGFASLTIDEGEAFLIQENSNTDGGDHYSGRFLIENNLILFNGKSGVVNQANKVTIKNNSYYDNGHLSGKTAFRCNGSLDIAHINNAIDANTTWGDVYSMGSCEDIYNEENYAYGRARRALPDGFVVLENSPFEDAKAFDFAVVESVPDTIGVPQEVLNTMKAKMKKYGITIQKTGYVPDQVAMTKAIVTNVPPGATVDYTHYDDDSYVIVKNIPDDHPIVTLTGKNEFRLNIEHKFERDE